MTNDHEEALGMMDACITLTVVAVMDVHTDEILARFAL